MAALRRAAIFCRIIFPAPHDILSALRPFVEKELGLNPPVFSPEKLRAALPQGATENLAYSEQNLRSYLQHYKLAQLIEKHDATHSIYRICAQGEEIVEQRFSIEGARFEVVLVHGYTDHTGLYRHVIDYWLKRGANVTIYDAFGHGLSTGRQADIDSFDRYIDLLDSRLSHVMAQSGCPLVLQGQSMGGAVIHSWLLRSKLRDRIALAVTNNPLVYPVEYSKVKLKVAALSWFVRSVKRTFTLSSHDTAYLDFVKNEDILQPRHTPVGWVRAMIAWINWFIEQPPLQFDHHLILQGDQDATVDAKINIECLEKVFPGARIEWVPRARHHLANESLAIRLEVEKIIDGSLADAGVKIAHDSAASPQSC